MTKLLRRLNSPSGKNLKSKEEETFTEKQPKLVLETTKDYGISLLISSL